MGRRSEDTLSRTPLAELMVAASAIRDHGFGNLITYSRKVFIPLTHLCRDACGYCTFAQAPGRTVAAFLSPEQVLDIAHAGKVAGCHEALFTLGDKPELRYQAARQALDALGFASTIDYLAAMCRLVGQETGLLAHVNPGVLGADDIALLRTVSASQGLMLESTAQRLCQPGGPHAGCPDKLPARRLATIEEAGRQNVPFTSGIMIGIGETRAERIEALTALHGLHETYGHIQEIIIQNFRAKPDTAMANMPEPRPEELPWTIARARHIFGPGMSIQAPPNLSTGDYPRLIEAGINDWGGVSPVTKDHVNPEAPWPGIEALAAATAEAGKLLVARLAVYPAFAGDTETWIGKALRPLVLRAQDADGLARTESWAVGGADPIPPGVARAGTLRDPVITDLIAKAGGGTALAEAEIATLFRARGDDYAQLTDAADRLRREATGDEVTYVVNRNINYTNICNYACSFCAFSKGRGADSLRGKPYRLDLSEIAARAAEAASRGATEVCLQGGIHPDYTGETYIDICRAVKDAVPDIHIHAFSPLEITQGAATLNMAVADYLPMLIGEGLGSLPGTAAEILDDQIRAVLCPGKLSTSQWIDVMETAHRLGLHTTATIMFGHLDGPSHWARHLRLIREVQERTGGFTEFVPLPFVHMMAPLYFKGLARPGPTFREAMLMHAIARLALHPVIPNIQTSWVKMGRDGARACLQAGCNDLGGTLMNESISRAAGSGHGQEMTAAEMETLITGMGRVPRRRSTLYGAPPPRDRHRGDADGQTAVGLHP